MKNFNIIITTIVILIVYAVLFSDNIQKNIYKMELLIRTPENSRVKLAECRNLNQIFQCKVPYGSDICSQDGNYFGKAVTYKNYRIISQTGWIALKNLC